MSAPLIIACLRWTDLRPYVDPLTGEVQRDERSAGWSPADAAALEHALRIADAWGGRVVAITAGPPAALGALREVLALGAGARHVAWPVSPGHGVHGSPLGPVGAYLEDLAGDEHGLACALAAAIRAEGEPALVVCGDRSADRGTGALPALLAHQLGVPQALGLVALAVEGDSLLGERRLDAGRRERLRILRPAVCSVEPAGVRLRRASLSALLGAAEDQVASEPIADTPAGHAVQVHAVRLHRPRTRVISPPEGDQRSRLATLTAALSTHEPPTVLGPLEPAEAADVLLSYLQRHGYALPEGSSDPVSPER